MPRSSRIRSAVGVVGSFAPSTTTLQSIVCAFVSLVMTPPRAAGTSQSHGTVQSSWFVIARPCGHSDTRSEEHTSDSSHRTISYAVFCLKKKKKTTQINVHRSTDIVSTL